MSLFASMESGLCVIGGRQRGERTVLEQGDGWYGYAAGVILHVGPKGAEEVLTYVSPPGVCGPDDPILFKSATVQSDRLYACTQTELLVLSVPDLEVVHHVSHPWFNDVHHVLPTATGTVLVASSGLEAVLEVDATRGEVIRTWGMWTDDVWAELDPDVDYRMGVDLKPHRAHPNHLFYLGDEPFVTRFELRDAVSLHDRTRRIAIDQERAHDGVVRGDQVYFTTVDGHVVIADSHTLEVVERVPLTAGVDHDGALGWCRGLYFEDEHVWVGFSRIRATKFRQTLSWIRTGMQRSLPTRIARYRLSDWTCDLELDLEPYGFNAVFTIAGAPAP